MKFRLRILTLLILLIVSGCSVKKPGLDSVTPATPTKSPLDSTGWEYEIEAGDKVITPSGWECDLVLNSATENLTSANGWTAEVLVE